MANPNWKPGISGNPSGRPLKSRALTEILERAGNKTLEVPGRKSRLARKRLLAELIWQLVAEGEAKLPNGKTLRPNPRDWLETLQFIYKHVDGPPVAGLDVTTLGEKLSGVIQVIEHKDGSSAS